MRRDARDIKELKAPDCPQDVLNLIERFGLHREAYRQPSYNETQVRREFIDPFFESLGWDVNNKDGYAEAYKDVIHEDAIKIGGVTKAPDYCFRVGGVRKFFVEAKKPAEDLRERPEHAYQLRRYAWTAKLPISILTDFEELAVFDCTKRPKPADKASAGRILYFTYDQYPDKWADIWSRFSKEAILKGEFDRFAESAKRKRGTAEVDDEFLKEIEQWRDVLARNIALRNPRLSVRELNYAVTKTIDRVIFLRMCEDRGIETYQQLRTLPNGPNIYPRLVEVFRRADQRYNSGLFHFEQEKGRAESPDTLTPGLTVDDKVLKDIIKGLYYPESPYEFSVMPPEILGQVYEQFLGKVITLTAGHRAKVEYKPEVRKAGGVYYTPKYIVDYIVEHTVGKLLNGKVPADVGPLLDQRRRTRAPDPSRARKEAGHTSPLTKGGPKGRRALPVRILDPACGSGSFLLGAYQYLLDWHLKWYSENDPDEWARKKNPPIYQSPKPDPTAKGPTWRLTVAEKKRILLNNTYGVDIDPYAVEVTKLSLLLKVLEGESQQTLENQLRLFHERALPDLGHNIKCGNSLIGPDFYEGKQFDLFDEGERYRINAFDWHAEFPEIMRAGGFDAVIGNPPWGADFAPGELGYLRRTHQRVIDRMIDSYIYFLHRAVMICQPDGYVGFIVPSTILNQVDAKSIRKLLFERGLSVVVNLGRSVFGTQVLNTSTVVVSQRRPHRIYAADLSALPANVRHDALAHVTSQPFEAWSGPVLLDSYSTFYVGDTAGPALLSRLSQTHPKLEQMIDGTIQRGVSPDIAAAHVVTDSQISEYAIEEDVLRPSISGGRVKRYHSPVADQWIIWTSRETPIDRYPGALSFLRRFRGHNKCREVKDGKHPWWTLHRPRDPKIFAAPKLIGLTTTRQVALVVDADEGLFVTDAMYVFRPTEGAQASWYAGVMQSRAFAFLYRVANQGESRVIPQVKASKLRMLPFPRPNGNGHIERLAGFVARMLSLHKQLAAARTPTDKTAIQRQIDAVDREIDQLVYELYALTQEEIRIVEQATKCL